MTKKVRRLSEQFRPDHYELELALDKQAMIFSGSVLITGQKIGRPGQRLTFHQHDLKITSAKVIRHERTGLQELSVDRINNQNRFDEVRLHSKQMLYPGSYTVELKFKGTITRSMNGIYPCFFKLNGKEEVILATQFESHHAREAFPCIDEPEAKATFQLSVMCDEAVMLSNTPVERTEGSKTVFQVTPKMSTYLLAFACGNFKHLEAKTKQGVTVRSYATPDNISHTTFALDVGVKCLEFYNDYFGIDYPLPKLDLIALPDFSAGAMENWGCVTFREQALFVDPKHTSLPMKQYVAMVVAHELAHQWFGNLVTMRWWTDLWLNEGFASWIEYLAVDHLFPDWDMWTQFVVDEQEQGLRLDALEFTHPVEVAINHPDEIHSIFDTISYSKGSSVIHMLHEYLGAQTFRSGLRHYLKEHAYGNTDTVDLWAALESISKKPVKHFMHAWTSQPGYPVIEAQFRKDAVALHQQRFCLNPQATTDHQRWPVPLKGHQALQDEVLEHAGQTYNVKAAASLWLNAGHSGFYRTVYDPAHLQKLADLVKAGSLPELDRLGLLSDAGEAAKAGYLSTVDALQLLAAYADETSPVVWDIIASLLGSFRAVMDDENLRSAVKPYVRNLTSKQLKRLGWQPKKAESYFDSLLRPTILSLAAVSDEPAVVSEAMKRFKAAKTSEDINPDVRGVVYGTAARKGNKAEFEKLLKLHNASTNSEDRVMLSMALSGFKQPELIKRSLALIDSKDVRLQDASYWLAYSFMNRHAKHQTWEWFTQHWAWLEKNLGNDLGFYRFPIYSARPWSDAAFLPTYKAFFAHHSSPAMERSINQGIETIEWQSAWRKRDLAPLKKFFKA